MKNLILFSFLVTLMSCDSVEKFRPAIEGLSTTWDSATASALQLSEMFGTEQNSFTALMAAMTPDEAKMKKLPAAAQTEITNAIAQCKSAEGSFSSLGGNIQAFIADWTAKGAGLEALKSGLTAGKIEGDVMAQVTELTNFATEGQTQIAGFQDALTGIKSSVAANHGNYMTLVEKYLSK